MICIGNRCARVEGGELLPSRGTRQLGFSGVFFLQAKCTLDIVFQLQAPLHKSFRCLPYWLQKCEMHCWNTMKGKLMTAPRKSRRIHSASLTASDDCVYISCHVAQIHSPAVKEDSISPLHTYMMLYYTILHLFFFLFQRLSKLLSNYRRVIYSFAPHWTDRTILNSHSKCQSLCCMTCVKYFNTGTSSSKRGQLLQNIIMMT